MSVRARRRCVLVANLGRCAGGPVDAGQGEEPFDERDQALELIECTLALLVPPSLAVLGEILEAEADVQVAGGDLARSGVHRLSGCTIQRAMPPDD